MKEITSVRSAGIRSASAMNSVITGESVVWKPMYQISVSGRWLAAALCRLSRHSNTHPDDISRLAADASARGPVRAVANVVGSSPSLGNSHSMMTGSCINASTSKNSRSKALPHQRGGKVYKGKRPVPAELHVVVW